MEAIKRFIAAGDRYIMLGRIENGWEGRIDDASSDEQFFNALDRTSEIRHKRYGERNSLNADANEVADLCREAGEDHKLIFKLCHLATTGGGPSKVAELWPDVRSMLESIVASGKPLRSPRRSRKQAEKPVTVWIRKNGHKYDDNKKAVRAYVEIYGGDEVKLYRDLNNDLRHKPYERPNKKRE